MIVSKSPTAIRYAYNAQMLGARMSPITHPFSPSSCVLARQISFFVALACCNISKHLTCTEIYPIQGL